MIGGLIDGAIKRRKVVLAVTAVLTLFGLKAYFDLPREAQPDIDATRAALSRLEGELVTGEDLLGRDVVSAREQIAVLRRSDFIGLFDTGAYGYVMASNYNSRPRAAEVLVDGNRFAIVTTRESYAECRRFDIPRVERTNDGSAAPIEACCTTEAHERSGR